MRIPYTYATVSRSDSAKRSMDAHAEFAPVEVSVRDAPVALRHEGFFGTRPNDDQGLRDRPERPVDGMTDVRVHEGRLYEAVVLVTGWAAGRERRLATADDVAPGRDVVDLFRDVPWIARRRQAPEAKYWNEVTKMTFSSSERDAARREVAMALDVIVVDGVLHRRSHEPVLQLHEGVVSVVPAPFAKGVSYRLDEVDLLADRLRSSRAPKAEETAEAARALAQVVDASALRHERRDDALRAAAHELLSTARHGFHLRRLDTMMAFKDLEEAIHAQDGAPSPQVAACMAAYCGQMRTERDQTSGWRDHAKSCDVAMAEVRAYEARAARGLPEASDEPDLEGLDIDGPGL